MKFRWMSSTLILLLQTKGIKLKQPRLAVLISTKMPSLYLNSKHIRLIVKKQIFWTMFIRLWINRKALIECKWPKIALWINDKLIWVSISKSNLIANHWKMTISCRVRSRSYLILCSSIFLIFVTPSPPSITRIISL